MPDFDKMAAEVVAAARGFIAQALQTVGTRIDDLEARFADFPTPKDGRDGTDGKDGAAGINGKDGHNGKDGENGRDGRDGLPGIQGEKGLDGRHGTDGKDGADGLGFDDLTVDYDGERSFALKFQRGEQVKEFAFVLPIVLDRGVWREQAYAKGDAVTWAGSTWIAQRDTETKPDAADGSWRLAVKRGRDARSTSIEPQGEKIVRLR